MKSTTKNFKALSYRKLQEVVKELRDSGKISPTVKLNSTYDQLKAQVIAYNATYYHRVAVLNHLESYTTYTPTTAWLKMFLREYIKDESFEWTYKNISETLKKDFIVCDKDITQLMGTYTYLINYICN